MQTIFITGASSGLGAAIAYRYAGPDSRLVLTGRDEGRLQITKSLCEEKGSEVILGQIDVTDQWKLREFIEKIDQQFRIDLMVANAGISGGTFQKAAGESLEMDRKIFDVNLMGVLNTIEPVIPRMVARKSGRIAVISSLASFLPMPGAPAYSASKAAVRYYAEGLAPGLKKSGVILTVFCPGFIKTPMTDINDFPMPFLMSAEVAADKIHAAMQGRQTRVDFPFIFSSLLKILQLCPRVLREFIFIALPEKKSLPKS